MKTTLRVLLWPLLVVWLLPCAVGSALAGCFAWLFCEDFDAEDGWGFFLFPFKFIWESFPLKGKK